MEIRIWHYAYYHYISYCNEKNYVSNVYEYYCHNFT